MWYGDGTFHVAPQHFTSCHGTASSTCARNHRPIYYSLFTINKSKHGELGIDITIESFRCNFENAAIKEFLTFSLM